MEPLKPIDVLPEFEDARGPIFKLLDGVEMQSLLHIKSRPGAVRGNHFHETMDQWVYLVEGGFNLHIQENPDTCDEKIVISMDEGEMIYVPAGVAHAFEIDRYTEFFEITDRVLGDDGERYDEDTVSVELI